MGGQPDLSNGSISMTLMYSPTKKSMMGLLLVCAWHGATCSDRSNAAMRKAGRQSCILLVDLYYCSFVLSSGVLVRRRLLYVWVGSCCRLRFVLRLSTSKQAKAQTRETSEQSEASERRSYCRCTSSTAAICRVGPNVTAANRRVHWTFVAFEIATTRTTSAPAENVITYSTRA